jgi:hypothetical protein
VQEAKGCQEFIDNVYVALEHWLKSGQLTNRVSFMVQACPPPPLNVLLFFSFSAYPYDFSILIFLFFIFIYYLY